MAEPRFNLEDLDAVLQEMGAGRGYNPDDPTAYLWARRVGTDLVIGSFAPESGAMTIRQDQAVAIAVQLRYEPYEVVRRLMDRGGENLDP